MPMHRGAFRELIGHLDAYPLSLGQMQARPGHLAVERVGIHRDAGQDRPADDGGLQREHFMKFMLMNSGTKFLRRFPKYVPPIIDFMKSDWKMKSPKPKPARYSTMRSIHIGKPNEVVMRAAKMIPVASPATQ